MEPPPTCKPLGSCLCSGATEKRKTLEERSIVTDSQLSARCFVYVHHCIKSSQPPYEITNSPQLAKDHTDITTRGQRMDPDIPSPTAVKVPSLLPSSWWEAKQRHLW